VIEVEGLRKQFGDLTAVNDVSFHADAGAIFGLLGPNGAGKTTTISCISGLLRPDAGRVRVLGHDVVRDGRASRERLGVVPQELALYEDLSARENLAYWGAAYGLRGGHLKQRVQEVLVVAGLDDRAKEPVKRFSGGMKRRLNFACALVHEPQALLLDEPTVGVDPQSRVRLLDLIREQARRGTCILYTTHYMEEAEILCDRLAILELKAARGWSMAQTARALLVQPATIASWCKRVDEEGESDEFLHVLDTIPPFELDENCFLVLLDVFDGKHDLPVFSIDIKLGDPRETLGRFRVTVELNRSL